MKLICVYVVPVGTVLLGKVKTVLIRNPQCIGRSSFAIVQPARNYYYLFYEIKMILLQYELLRIYDSLKITIGIVSVSSGGGRVKTTIIHRTDYTYYTGIERDQITVILFCSCDY